ncbi:MAG: SMP-30/gluconolactonase/LRE family protein [Deltaproteobacteria bacterium]|nr:SMP-30/gluconolactonase/LRE family protein [Deltaproteobacteria bacterium]
MGWLLGERKDDLPLLSPFAVAVSNSEIVWVADTGTQMLYRLDLARQSVDYFQELAGQPLVSPSGIAVDDQRQRVYLADSALGEVFVMDLEGNYLASWKPQGGFKRPVGLAIDNLGRLLVSDVLDGSVLVFDQQGETVDRIGSKVNPDGRFNRPLSVAVGPNGEVLILDAMSFRIEVQSAQGELIGTIGQLGDAAGFLARPKGLAVDREGHVFISDAAFDNIQIFDLAGKLLMYFGGAGNQPGQFNLPAGLYVDREGRLFAADSYNHRVQVFKILQE